MMSPVEAPDPNAEARTGALKVIGELAAALTEAEKVVALLTPPHVPPPGGGDPPVPPPVLRTVPQPGALDVTWEQPAAMPAAMLSWGGGGTQLGKLGPFLARGTVTKRIELGVGTTVTVDVLVGQAGSTAMARWATAEGTSGPPLPPPGPPPTGVNRPVPPAQVADMAGWSAWRAAMRAWCGAPVRGLRPVASAADLAGLGAVDWRDGDLWVLGPALLHGLDIAGRVYVAAKGLTLEMGDVRCHAVHWGRDTGGTFKATRLSCTGTRPGYPLGQGAVNMWGTAAGWLLTRCELTGCADGMQTGSSGSVADLWVHNLSAGKVPSGGPTHNDGIQLYGGTITADGYLFEAAPGSGSNSNGLIITNGPTAVLRGRNVWAETAGGNVVNPHQGQVYLDHSVLKGGAVPYQGQLHLVDSLRQP